MATFAPFCCPDGDLGPVVRVAPDAQLRVVPHPVLHNLGDALEGLRELLHAVVLSFFVLLWLPAWMARKRALPLVREYIFVLSLVIFSHFWIGIFLPIGGPASIRSQVIPDGSVFIPAAGFLTQAAFRGGSAVTSLFAAAGVTIAAYGGKLFPTARRLYVLWLFLLLISTVVCSFHYSVSTIAGVLSGTVFLVIGRKLYEKTV